MKILIDTNVLSEARRPDGNPLVRARLAAYSREDTYLSALTIGEIAMGIALLQDGQRQRDLARWLNKLELDYRDQILTVDRVVARRWGQVTAICRQQGIPVPITDGLMAATALTHGLTVMTRNTRHFAATGVRIIDPWADD